jgi:hypothetical protein
MDWKNTAGLVGCSFMASSNSLRKIGRDTQENKGFEDEKKEKNRESR